MSAFSPFTAAMEGFHVMRRHPKAVMMWTLVWLGALIAIGAVVASQGRAVQPAPGGQTDALAVVARFGPLAALIIPTLLFVWVVVTSATYRAVLEPEDEKWSYLRLGQDEVRLTVVTAVAFVAAPLVVGGVGYLLLVIANPFFEAAPGRAQEIAFVGGAITGLLVVWLMVRLSLIAVETLAENRFHLTAYWPLTRGQFWRLLIAYLILTVILMGLGFVWSYVGAALIQVTSAVGVPQGADPVRRVVLVLLVALSALYSAIAFVVPTTLICACQAHAFRALYGDNYPKDRKL
jgi:hypothetical protein